MKIDFPLIVFGIASASVLFFGLYVVLTKNIVRAAFALLMALFSVAVIYVTLQADFIAAVQVLIYVGGINILIIFGVMLTEHTGKVPFRMVSLNVVWAALVCLVLFGVLMYGLIGSYNWPAPGPEVGATTASIGKLLLSDYVLPFEVTSVLLLAVLIGAVAVGRKEVNK